MIPHRCRGCRSVAVERVLDLGAQPAADLFPPAGDPGPDPLWPLQLWLCPDCGLAQLGPVEPLLPEVPLAVESATSVRHAATSVRALLGRYPGLRGAATAEFASHHGGSWLPELTAVGCRPAPDDRPAELVVDVHGLAHEPDPGRALAVRAARLAPGGLMVLEFHHLLALVEGNQFDTVRHGHWSYLSLGALVRLVEPLGLVAVAVTGVPLFGGCLRVVLAHAGTVEPEPGVRRMLDREARAGLADPATLAGLRTGADRAAAGLRGQLVDLRRRGLTVLGYGAPSKAPVLLGLSGIGPDLLAFTADAAPGKHGRRIPGAGVPIRSVDELRAARPDVVLMLVWDIADEVIDQLEADGGWGARYLLPMPTPHLVEPSGRTAAGLIAGAAP